MENKKDQDGWTPEAKAEYEKWLDKKQVEEEMKIAHEHKDKRGTYLVYENKLGDKHEECRDNNGILVWRIIHPNPHDQAETYELQVRKHQRAELKTVRSQNRGYIDKTALDYQDVYFRENTTQNSWEAALEKVREENLGKKKEQQIEKQRNHTHDYDQDR